MRSPAQLRRLTKEGIRVFIIRGNHDAESSIARHLSLPEGIHVFTGHGGMVEIDDRDVAIHGVSFARPELPESLLPKYRQPLPDCTNIGLLHTSLAGAEGHDVYASCSLADLTVHGFDFSYDELVKDPSAGDLRDIVPMLFVLPCSHVVNQLVL